MLYTVYHIMDSRETGLETDDVMSLNLVLPEVRGVASLCIRIYAWALHCGEGSMLCDGRLCKHSKESKEIRRAGALAVK